MTKPFRRGVAAVAVFAGSLAAVSIGGSRPAGAVSGPLCSTVSWVAAGQSHAFAQRADGSVWGWGNNARGQLLLGDTVGRTAPAAVEALRGAVAVAAGSQFTVALFPGGIVRTAGLNNYGQLGNGTVSDSRTLVSTGLTDVTAIDVGGYHVAALKSDGTVWSWGRNIEGQTSGSTPPIRQTPVQVAGLTGVVQVAAGWYHTLALKSDGTVWAWGHNADGQLGNGSRTSTNVPVQVSGLTGVAAVDGGVNFSAARMPDGTVRTWGSGAAGQLGSPGVASRTTPQPVPDLTGVTKVATGSFHVIATTADGRTLTWGSNSAGQLGTGPAPALGSRPKQSSTPVVIAGASGASSVVAGALSSYAVRGGGTLWAWGSNASGQIGNGTTTEAPAPVQSGCPNDAVLPWALVLAADPPVSSTGMPVTLTAVTNQDVADTPYAIQIFDKQSGMLLSSCATGTSCVAVVSSPTPGTLGYVAHVATPSVTAPPPFSQTSAETTVRWGKLGPGPYSASCAPPTYNVFDGESLGNHALLQVRRISSDETWVCFRFNDDSTWLGGRIALVSPALAPPTIAVDDKPPSACARNDNQAPGPHPLVSDPLGTVDVFAKGSEAWVCFSSGGATARVMVGSSLPSAVIVNLDGL